jgi:hypothetical protein
MISFSRWTVFHGIYESVNVTPVHKAPCHEGVERKGSTASRFLFVSKTSKLRVSVHFITRERGVFRPLIHASLDCPSSPSALGMLQKIFIPAGIRIPLLQPIINLFIECGVTTHARYILRRANRCFENMAQFRYFGTTITNQNLIQDKIKRKLHSGNACYHSAQKLLSSSLLYKNINIIIYKIIMLPVVLYGCETWSLTSREEWRLRMFEKRVLRRIFGPKRDDVAGG